MTGANSAEKKLLRSIFEEKDSSDHNNNDNYEECIEKKIHYLIGDLSRIFHTKYDELKDSEEFLLLTMND